MFVLLGWILLLITPYAVKLSVWIGVGGCGWPILVSICQRYMASRAFRYSAPYSALAADVITAFVIVTIVRMAPLLVGVSHCWSRRNVPPLVFVISFHCNIPHCCGILFAEYDMIASSCNVQ